MIGYWANTKRWTQTHIVNDDESEKPICGSQIKEDLSFQWCCNGIRLDYIECSHCKHWYKKQTRKK